MDIDIINENDDNKEEVKTDESFKSPDQLSDELVTLSLLPESRWRSLVNLEVIKVDRKEHVLSRRRIVLIADYI